MNDFDMPWTAETGDFEIYSTSRGDAIAYAESAKVRARIIECVNGFDEVKRQRDDAISQLARICQEGFGNQDTIGQESAADYILRHLAAAQAEIVGLREALKDCMGRASDKSLETHPDDHAKGALDDIWEWAEKALASPPPPVVPAARAVLRLGRMAGEDSRKLAA